MFLLREFVQNILLVEGKKEDILLKYPNFKDEIDFFVQNDPTSKLKYLDWEMKVLSSGKALEQEIADVVKLFDKFQSQLQKKDINQYSVDDFTTLRDDLFTLRDKQSKKKEKVEKRYQLENKPNSEIVYDSDNYQIILIKNKEASVHFGAGTKWCVTMKQETYFEQYDANNVILFFIFSKQLDKSSPNYKIACSVQRDENNKVLIQEYWNSKDKQINKTVSKVIGSEFGDIDSTIKQIAVQQPKSILAKLKSGEATEEEIVQIYEAYKNHQNEKERQAVLQLVAKSKNIPVEVLSQLAKDKNSDVRYYVARNPSTPVEVLSQLAEDENSDVRYYVARNPSTPVEVLSQLAVDKNSDVREQAKFNLKQRSV